MELIYSALIMIAICAIVLAGVWVITELVRKGGGR